VVWGRPILSNRSERALRWFTCFLGLALTTSCWAQPGKGDLMTDVLTVFDFRAVPITWNMNGQSQVFLNEGRNYLSEKDYANAINQFTKAIEVDRSARIAYYFRAMANKQPNVPLLSETDMIGQRSISRAERIGNALDDILKFLDTYPDSEEGILEAAKIQILRKEPKDAIDRLKKFSKLRPDDARGPYFLGMAYLQLNDLGMARKNFASCMAIDPTFVSGLVQLGGLEMAVEKNDDKALTYFDQALLIDSMQWSARFFKYNLLVKVGKHRDALESLNFLVKYNPANWRIRGIRATTLIQLESYRDAFADLRVVMENSYLDEATHIGMRKPIDRWIDIQNVGTYVVRHVFGLPDEEALALRKAFCLLVVGRDEESIAAITENHSLMKQPAATYLCAVACEYSGKLVEAEENYARTAQLDPELFDAYKKCALMLVIKRQWKEALPYYDTMESLNPEYPPTFRNRGVAYFCLGELDKAVEDLNHCIRMDSTNLGTYFDRGQCLSKQGKYFESLRDIVKSKRYEYPDYKAYQALIDELFVAMDTVMLSQYAKLFIQIPTLEWGMGYGVAFEVTKMKLVEFHRDWEYVNNQYRYLNSVVAPSNDPVYVSYALAAKGVERYEAGDMNEALRMFDEALSRYKKNAAAYYHRGRVWLKLNEQRKARDDFNRAASLGDSRARLMLSK